MRRGLVAAIVAVSLSTAMLAPAGTGQPDKVSKIIPDECCATASWDVDTASDQ